MIHKLKYEWMNLAKYIQNSVVSTYVDTMMYSVCYTCIVYAICILRECLLRSNAESLHFMMGPFYPNKTWTNLWTIRWRELLSHIVWTNYFIEVHVTVSKTFYSFVEFSSEGHTYSILLDLHTLLHCWFIFFVHPKTFSFSWKNLLLSCIKKHGHWRVTGFAANLKNCCCHKLAANLPWLSVTLELCFSLC